ncbi:MAG: NfeD family protein [Planctomycetota bacterium]
MSPWILLAQTADAWLLAEALGLFVLALVLVVAEVLVVSGGLLGLAACIAALFSIRAAFQYDMTTGWIFLIVSPLIGLYVLRLGIKQMQKSSWVSQSTVSGRSGYGHTDDPGPRPQVGDAGIMLTSAHPGGRARFAAGTWDVHVLDGACEKDSQVVITEIAGPRILVRLISEPADDA